jgi:8-oxo-(d)GTP phosphatase
VFEDAGGAGGSFRASREVDEMEWLPIDEGGRRLTSASDRRVLGTFARTRPDTGALVLVRHGETTAPVRHLKANPASRRLSRSGRDQAAALVPVPEGLGVTDLLSVDVPACVDMLAPFAAATGLTVRREPRLTRDGFAGHGSDVADHVRRDATSSEALVVCGEQRVITGLLSALDHASEIKPPREPTVRKGGWWLLHHRDGAIRAYERYDPAA